MMNYLSHSKHEEHQAELEALEDIMGKQRDWNCERMNSVLIGAIQDPEYYSINPGQRFILICCLIPEINHEYAYFEIVNEFASK